MVLQRLLGGAQVAASKLAALAGARLYAIADKLDRPYSDQWAGAAQWAALAAMLLLGALLSH